MSKQWIKFQFAFKGNLYLAESTDFDHFSNFSKPVKLWIKLINVKYGSDWVELKLDANEWDDAFDEALGIAGNRAYDKAEEDGYDGLSCYEE